MRKLGYGEGVGMKKYIIVAESGADLTREMIEENDIRIAPMHIEMDGIDYLDGTIPISQITDYYDRTGKVPKTAGVNSSQYEEIFARIKKETPDAVILHVCYSAQLSCGYQSSIIADDGTMPVYRVDAKNVSIGHAYVVMKVIEIINKQPEIEPGELVKKVEYIAERTRFSFVPGNLVYLRAGGRVSNAQYLGATLLKILPTIEVIDGLMLSKKKYRGSDKRIIRNMLTDYFKKFNIDKEMLFLGYVCAISDEIKDEMNRQAKEAGIKNIVWLMAGGVITSHSGQGGIGIAGLDLE